MFTHLRPALMAAAMLAAMPALSADVVPPPGPAGTACVGICGTSAADGDIALSPLGKPSYGYVSTFGSTASGVSPLALGDNKTGIETNGSRLRTDRFTASAGDRLSVYFNYVSTDGNGYDDYAWARVLDAADDTFVAWLFTARSTNSGTRNVVPGDVLDKKAFDPDAVIVDYDRWDFVSKTSTDPVDWSPLGQSNGTCWEDNAKGCGYTGWLQSRHTFAATGTFRLEFGVVNWGDEAFDSGLAFDYAGLAPGSVITPVPEPASWALMALGLVALPVWRRRRQIRQG